jgi:hypothetical protein
VQVYALTSSRCLHETLDLFLTREAAEAELREILEDEPDWRDVLRVVGSSSTGEKCRTTKGREPEKSACFSPKDLRPFWGAVSLGRSNSGPVSRRAIEPLACGLGEAPRAGAKTGENNPPTPLGRCPGESEGACRERPWAIRKSDCKGSVCLNVAQEV